ncbi:F0F1 ATP synthase subunit A [Clostridium estertheticum]|uniref:F0F1 ATP synthase subunit A n=1 Tax=Clostridium estertheticum TaxID=238834 RepID=UPI001C7D53C9|nr:F0F1 ATP synthase subunit A [Clostridium estertheticum]MBX4260739.1 F0F1 ATP synthase subunit A [Clostridium estertheticum]MCB2306365.1 F0F1 ATP synthase subunit A [Clostridium estertheticum]MCB2344741.1 F0F1 ATP synthase subunit A [Clostridium estertheticum]MCB2349664.1 F0F1 ATP synthase subunit A [Clostridium estertheticum]WAG46826.1 F0F1 ATP synthase subunit A [Clostridium estertheticum]
MDKIAPLFHIKFFGYSIGIAGSIFVQWCMIAVIAILCAIFTRNLKIIPDKKQNIIEMIMDFINNLVKDNMGEEYMGFVPYVATIVVFLSIANISGMVGITPATSDYSVSLALALITFFVVQWFAIKKIGIGHYFKGYAEPYAFILPINLMERVMLPVSLSFRLFGNITAGVVIIELAYKGLAGLSGFAQFLIPIPLHFYFDLFDGLIQMVIFVMLTMINIKVTAEH